MPLITCLVLAVLLPGAAASNAGVAPCDAEDPAQAWSLRLTGSWGESATLVNVAEAEPQCLDVANRRKGPGVLVRSWRCCCAGLKTTAGTDVCGRHPCGDIKDNYNQVYVLSTDGHLTTGKVMGEMCLSIKHAGVIETEACDATSTKWIYSATQQPPLRLAANTSMCLTATATSPSGPSPAPDPERPVEPVAQACTAPNTTGLPFCDRSLATAVRVKDLLGRLALGEKLTQLIGGIGGGVTPGIRDLFPPYQYHSEGLHGLRSTCGLGSHGPARNHTQLFSTLFPQVTAMAATGNLELVKTMAAHMAEEARAVNNYMEGNTVGKGGGLDYWGPTMNVARDPRWGRIQESVSEDPFLNGGYAAQFVAGFQGAGDGVGYTKAAACCKHFYAYSLEGSDGFTRHNFNAVVSKRDLHETFLPAFQTCVAAQPEQIMCSYNAVNGVPTCLDGDAQNGWLRGKLGYRGLIVSDCDAVGDAWRSHKYCDSAANATALGIKHGCDQDCGSTYKAANLQGALSAGLLSESDVDVALGRIMTMRFNLGMFDGSAVPYTRIPIETTMNSAAGQKAALAAARESIVLLKNSKRTLPLDETALRGRTVLMIGPPGGDARVLMGGKSDYCPEHSVSLFEGLQARANASGFTALYAPTLTAAVEAQLRSAAAVLLTVGGVLGSEGRDRVNISLPAPQPAMVESVIAALGPRGVADKLVLVLVNGEPVAIDQFEPRIGAIVEAMEGGQAGGTALADVLFGDVSPSAMLPFTMVEADFVNQVKMDDMSMRPNAGTGSPGKTYRFYNKKPTFVFGFGLSYVDWGLAWGKPMPAGTQSVAALHGGLAFPVTVTNRGNSKLRLASPAGKIVQLYITITKGHDSPPHRSLVALEKVFLRTGASAEVALHTAAFNGTCAFCVVDAQGTPQIQPGYAYELTVGDGGGSVPGMAPYSIVAQ